MHEKNMKSFRLIYLSLSLLFCDLAAANGISEYGVYVYSNFCISKMSGDLTGNRITLIRTADGDKVIYEYDDGQTNTLVAKKTGIDNSSRKMEFLLNDSGGVTTVINGEFSKDGKSLMLHHALYGNSATTLNLISDFSIPITYCK
ncbi:hypothetical protein [Undibacterium rugosum]|uniref:hypothetical protein n=1 Tax=Undibacterium rugosum TaxID=2762291 RepID=UPI001B81D9FE|nr:hypothetical protein [Undibacterium rugosum]MBR7777279.1 hypothetical protein [Undibacterium rugosum]